jgi:glycosyltransferase involved in cell wall biosynthesis
LKELLQFDGIAAVSEASRAALLDYWDWLGSPGQPPVAAIPLGIEAAPRPGQARGPVPIVLSVGSIEGRKNHLALLDACESLWAAGARFELRLVGLANLQTGAPALRRVEALRRAGRPIRFEGPLPESRLEDAYAECAFTVYPSLAEGFGLPVAESLARGKPCVCRGDGALGEMARGGGCVVLASSRASEIASAVGGLLSSGPALAALEAAAQARRFRSWEDYAGELLGWMATLATRRGP